jgi:hypothetical protein
MFGRTKNVFMKSRSAFSKNLHIRTPNTVDFFRNILQFKCSVARFKRFSAFDFSAVIATENNYLPKSNDESIRLFSEVRPQN